MKHIAGTVVLYNPGEEVLAAMASYARQVGVLFAIDNSEAPAADMTERVRSLPGVVYRWNGRNLGIAAALNVGASMALAERCEYLLMMDQDSVASDGMTGEYVQYLSRHASQDIGILSPMPHFENYGSAGVFAASKDVEVAITGGSLLNLAAYRDAGPFMESLFIDYVDFEYCLRLRARGYRVVQVGSAVVHQKLGNVEPRRFLFFRVAVTHHSPLRVYYRFRNRLVVARMYMKRFPRWSILELRLTFNELMKIICFEPRKAEMCRMALKGVADFAAGRLGPYGSTAGGDEPGGQGESG